MRRELILLMVSMFFAAGTAAGEVRIKFATVAPEGTTWMKAMHEFDRELREATDARVRFVFFPGGIAGDEKDILRKMRYGKIHATGVTGVGMGRLVPESRVLDLPFFFENHDEVDRVHDALFDHFSRLFERKGYVLVAWSEVGWTYLLSMRDLSIRNQYSRLKMWTWEGDPIALKTLEELGTNPVSLPVGEVLTSLQTGLLDTVYTPPLAAIAMQWDTKVETLLKTPLVHSSGALLVLKKEFDRMHPEDAAVFLKLGKKIMAELKLETRHENRMAIEDMIRRGIRPVEPDESLGTLFRKTAAAVRNAFSGTLYPADLLAKTEAIRDARAGES